MSVDPSLATAYAEFPALPRDGLIELVVDALENDEARADDIDEVLGRALGEVVPEDILEDLVELIDTDHPDKPIKWHLRRAMLRATAPLVPKQNEAATKAVERWWKLLTAWENGPDEGFVLAGLTLAVGNDHVTEHAIANAADPDVAVFLGMSATVEFPRDLLVAVVPPLVDAMVAAGRPAQEDPTTIDVPPATTASPRLNDADLGPDARRALAVRALVIRALAGDHALWIIARCKVPLAPCIEDHEQILLGRYDGDDVILEYGKRIKDTEFERLKQPHAIAATAIEEVRLRWRVRQLFNVRDVPVGSGTSDEILHGLVAAVKAQPALARDLGIRLRSWWTAVPLRGHKGIPTQETVVAAGIASPALLESVFKVGWTDPLRGRGDLVESALAIEDVRSKAEVLLAIGEPATKALEALVDADLAIVATLHDARGADDAEARYHMARERIAWMADQAAVLGLAFWERRIDRPGALAILVNSKRLRAAFTLKPDAVHRLVRRADHQNVAHAAVHILEPLASSTIDLSVVADEVCAIVASVHRASKQSRRGVLSRASRLALLAQAGGPAALDHIDVEALEVVVSERDALLSVATRYDEVWKRLKSHHLYEADDLAAQLRDRDLAFLADPHTFCPEAARDATLALVKAGAATDDEAEKREIRRAIEHLIMARGDVLDAATLQGAGEAMDRLRHAELGRGLNVADLIPDRNRRGQGPWEDVFESDLGNLLPQIGQWYADRIATGAVPQDVQEVLRKAVVSRCRAVLPKKLADALGASGAPWPTRDGIVAAAQDLGIVVDEKTLDRCADEGLPTAFRAAVGRLVQEHAEGTGDGPVSKFVAWVFENAWSTSPELLARHLMPELEAASDVVWRRSIVAALVALREPCGTQVVDTITHVAAISTNDAERENLFAQRNTFARDVAAAERAKNPLERTRSSRIRLLRGARSASGTGRV